MNTLDTSDRLQLWAWHELVPYIFKLSDIVVGEHIGFLQVLIRVQGLSDQTLPKGAQQVQRKWHVCSDGYAQKLAEEVQQLLLGIAYGAGSQDVFPLSTAKKKKKKRVQILTMKNCIPEQCTRRLFFLIAKYTRWSWKRKNTSIHKENWPCCGWQQHWGREAATRELSSVTLCRPATGNVWRSHLSTGSTKLC